MILPRPDWRAGHILKRSSLLNLLLIIAIGFVAFKTYGLWQEADRKPVIASPKGPSSAEREATRSPVKGRSPSTEIIVEKNLFDVDRSRGSSGKGRPLTQDAQTIEGLALLGTIVTDGERFAIVRVPPNLMAGVGKGSSRTGGAVRRLALGDTVLGFRLSEIRADRVVFKKGSSEVELVLHFAGRAVRVQERPRAKQLPKTRSKKTVRKKKR